MLYVLCDNILARTLQITAATKTPVMATTKALPLIYVARRVSHVATFEALAT
jgi:hypothetical protein